jgi:hypothetical protein
MEDSLSTPVNPSAEELRRLSLVRHLYSLGVTQSHGAAPTAALSILPFHDAAEAFLQLACERYEAGENKADFMQYWSLLGAKGIQVSQRETMRRLNAARRVLKHQGVLPAEVEIEGFRAAVTNFFYDATPMLFGIDFNRVSLVHLVADDVVRQKLEEAYAALEANDHQTALGCAAVAFILVQRAHDQNQAQSLPPYTQATLPALVARSSLGGFALNDLERVIGRPIRRFAGQLDDAIKTLSESLELVSRGLPLADYVFFKAYAPIVHQMIGGSMTVEWMKEFTKNPDVVRRCLSFVVDAAVRLGV